MRSFDKDLEKFEAERVKLLTEVSKARNELSGQLHTAISSILMEFEESTGFKVSGVEVAISENWFFGEVDPKYILSNVKAQLSLERRLER